MNGPGMSAAARPRPTAAPQAQPLQQSIQQRPPAGQQPPPQAGQQPPPQDNDDDNVVELGTLQLHHYNIRHIIIEENGTLGCTIAKSEPPENLMEGATKQYPRVKEAQPDKLGYTMGLRDNDWFLADSSAEQLGAYDDIIDSLRSQKRPLNLYVARHKNVPEVDVRPNPVAAKASLPPPQASIAAQQNKPVPDESPMKRALHVAGGTPLVTNRYPELKRDGWDLQSLALFQSTANAVPDLGNLAIALPNVPMGTRISIAQASRRLLDQLEPPPSAQESSSRRVSLSPPPPPERNSQEQSTIVAEAPTLAAAQQLENMENQMNEIKAVLQAFASSANSIPQGGGAQAESTPGNAESTPGNAIAEGEILRISRLLEQRGHKSLCLNTVSKLKAVETFYENSLCGENFKQDDPNDIVLSFLDWAASDALEPNLDNRLQPATLRGRLGSLKSLLEKQKRCPRVLNELQVLLTEAILTYCREESKELQHRTMDVHPEFTKSDHIHVFSCTLENYDCRYYPTNRVMLNCVLSTNQCAGRRTTEIAFIVAGTMRYEMQLTDAGTIWRRLSFKTAFCKQAEVCEEEHAITSNGSCGFACDAVAQNLLYQERIAMIDSAHDVFCGIEAYNVQNDPRWEQLGPAKAKITRGLDELKAEAVAAAFTDKETSAYKKQHLITKVCQMDAEERAAGTWKQCCWYKLDNNGSLLFERFDNEASRALSSHGKFVYYNPSKKHNFGQMNCRAGRANDSGTNTLGSIDANEARTQIMGHSGVVRKKRYNNANQTRRMLTNNFDQEGVPQDVVDHVLKTKNDRHRPAYNIDAFYQKGMPAFTDVYDSETALSDYSVKSEMCGPPTINLDSPDRLFPCWEKNCDSTFHFFGDLQNHVNAEHKEGDFECPGARNLFTKYKPYREHVSRSTCKHCENHPLRLQNHMNQAQRVGTAKVKKMGREMTSEVALVGGEAEPTRFVAPKHWCPDCNKSLVEEKKIKRHYYEVHGKTKDDYIAAVLQCGGRIPPKTTSKFICSVCCSDFKSQTFLERHYNRSAKSGCGFEMKAMQKAARRPKKTREEESEDESDDNMKKPPAAKRSGSKSTKSRSKRSSVTIFSDDDASDDENSPKKRPAKRKRVIFSEDDKSDDDENHPKKRPEKRSHRMGQPPKKKSPFIDENPSDTDVEYDPSDPSNGFAASLKNKKGKRAKAKKKRLERDLESQKKGRTKRSNADKIRHKSQRRLEQKRSAGLLVDQDGSDTESETEETILDPIPLAEAEAFLNRPLATSIDFSALEELSGGSDAADEDPIPLVEAAAFLNRPLATSFNFSALEELSGGSDAADEEFVGF